MYDYYLKTQRDCTHFSNLRFESRVILDGSQTMDELVKDLTLFESRVILDGSQTKPLADTAFSLFESRVILDGSQTASHACSNSS